MVSVSEVTRMELFDSLNQPPRKTVVGPPVKTVVVTGKAVE